MSPAVTAVMALLLAAALSLVVTPATIALAHRIGFYDRPREYREHGAPTPFLGGAAVLLALLVTSAALGDLSGKLLPVAALALLMWGLGTVDDAVAVAPVWRLLAVAASAVLLYLMGLGWRAAAGDSVDLLLTVVWIVGLVNAFNLMDNLDGACSTVAAVSAAGVGVLALVKGQPAMGAVAFAISGACAGFLPWNLAGPARTFLGDGGSMPLGFLIGALAMMVTRHSAAGHAGILDGGLLVGLPILDVALVSLSRTRRGVSLVTGGRDHLTHRTLLVLPSPRLVALALAAAQMALCALAIGGYSLGAGGVAGFGLMAFLAGVAAVLILDSPRWRPAGIAMAPEPTGEPVPLAEVNVDSA